MSREHHPASGLNWRAAAPRMTMICWDADEAETAAQALRDEAARVETIQADLATQNGLEKLTQALGG
jgi:short-subunit dehydrogenase